VPVRQHEHSGARVAARARFHVAVGSPLQQASHLPREEQVVHLDQRRLVLHRNREAADDDSGRIFEHRRDFATSMVTKSGEELRAEGVGGGALLCRSGDRADHGRSKQNGRGECSVERHR
jgi:hypothetical protein